VAKIIGTKADPDALASGQAVAAADESATCALCKAGEFWTVGYPGALFHIRDSKGLAYIAHLLRNPGVEFHVLDLARIGGGEADPAESDQSALVSEGLRTGALGDAGELLDEKTKSAYRSRLTELREMLEDAGERGDSERGAEIEDEIEALSRELSRAVGKGGRQRRAASAPERARVAVTKAIKYALDKIAQNDSKLADILERSIKTGAFCVYDQKASAAPKWDFGMPAGSAAAPIGEPQQPAPAVGDGAIGGGIALGKRTEFVGREAERKQIAAAFEAAVAGSGSVVLIGGGAGVGKTRLAIECARQASSAVVLLGRCYETGEPHPYIPFVEIIERALATAPSNEAFRTALGENAPELAQLVPRLRRLFPDIPAPLELPPQQAQRYLFDSLFQFLERAARVRPVFLILDDLHWADDATLALLTHLARRVSAVAAVIVGTFRDTPAEMSPALAKTLEDLIREGVRPVRLQGLSQPRVAEMIRALCGSEPAPELVETVHYETGGNPFFVEELVKHLLEEDRLLDASGHFRADLKPGDFAVPESVGLVVGRRLDRLSESTREVLAGAAAIGRRFDFGLLESVIESGGGAVLGGVEEALKSGLIVSGSNGDAPLAFTHEIVRQCILGRVAPPRLQRLHLRVAQAMEARYADSLDENAAAIAGHLLAAGPLAPTAEVADFLIRAGRRASAASAYRDALHFFETALGLLAPGGSAARAELLSDLGMTKRSLDRWEEALAHWRESLSFYAGAGDLSAVGRVSSAIVEALSWAGRYMDAAQVAYTSLAHLRDSVSADRARLLGAVGMINSAAGEYQGAHDALAEAAHLAGELHDERTLGAVVSYQSFHDFVFLRLNRAIDEGQRSAELLRGSGALWSLAQMLGFLQTAMFLVGRIEDARAIARELEPLAARLGHSAARMLCIRTEAWCEFCLNPSLDAMAQAFAHDLEITQSSKLPWIATSYSQLGFVNFLRGDWEQARALNQQACNLELPNAFEGFGAGGLFRQLAYLGKRDEALELLEQRKGRLPRLGSPNRVGAWSLLMLVIEGLYVLGERERAAELYPAALQVVNTDLLCLTVISRFTHTAAGIGAAAGRQWQRAEAHFQTAIERAESMPHPLERLDARRFYGQMLLERAASGDRARARAMLTEALQGYERLAMPKYAAISKALLDRAAG
jgi:tetratricopeptide (TPR) repeat protein